MRDSNLQLLGTAAQRVCHPCHAGLRASWHIHNNDRPLTMKKPKLNLTCTVLYQSICLPDIHQLIPERDTPKHVIMTIVDVTPRVWWLCLIGIQ